MAVRLIDREALKEVLNMEATLGYIQTLADVFRVIDKQPTLTPPNEWVRPEEKLPEMKQTVLVYRDEGFAVAYIFDMDMLTKEPVWSYTGLGGDPWYWMPIPAPPDRRPPEGGEDINVPTKAPNEWISVEEAVPDPGERVIATDGIFVGEAYRTSAKSWHRYDAVPWRNCFAGRTVRFWRPMPESPEGEEDT